MGRGLTVAGAVFAFTLPLEATWVHPQIGSLARVAGGLLVLAAGVVALRRERVIFPVSVAVMAAFVVWMGLTQFWAYVAPGYLGRWGTLLQMWILVICVIQLEAQRSVLAAVAAGYLAGSVVAAGAMWVTWTLGGAQELGVRLGVAGYDPNETAVALVLAIPIAAWFAIERGSTVIRINSVFAVAVLTGACVLTGSRAGMAGLIGTWSFLAVAVSLTRGWGRVTGVLVAGATAALVAVAVRSAEAMLHVERMATLGQEVTAGTWNHRTTLWQEGMRLIMERPWVGWGYGAAWTDPALRGWSMHNALLEVVVGGGVIAGVMFSAVVAMMLLPSWPRNGMHRALWLAACCPLVVAAMSLSYDNRKQLWLALALSVVAARFGRSSRVREGRASLREATILQAIRHPVPSTTRLP